MSRLPSHHNDATNRQHSDWLRLAAKAAKSSPHPTVRVGAVITTPDGEHLLGTGANAPPDGIALTPERLKHGAKSLWFMCAEKRALAAAQRKRGKFGLESLRGCRLYTTLDPCHTCAHDILQAGLTLVCVPQGARDRYPKLKPKYRRSIAAATAMFTEKGIGLTQFDAPDALLERRRRKRD